MKTFDYTANVGKVRHVVTFHNGEKFHKDGSPFSDIRVFSNQKECKQFIQSLRNEGYVSKFSTSCEVIA